MNLHQALTHGESMLQDYGISDPRWNAERILQRVLGIDRARLYADLHAELAAEQEASYRDSLTRRALHYPLAYLEGSQEFYGQEFFVNESVLIPRPETEEIVRAVLNLPLPREPLILDVGSGSGAIAVTLRNQIPGSRVFALERSRAALSVLTRNAQGKVQVLQGDLNQLPFLNETFHVLVSNPPYVKLSEFDALPAETRWEPREALVTDDAGEMYRKLLLQSLRVLKPRGFLIFEIGFGQSENMKSLCEEYTAFIRREILVDFQRIPRTFVLQKA